VAAEVAEAPRRWDLVIGHSLGGAVAVTVAAAEPMWAEALLLLDPVLALPVGAVDAVLADLLGDLEGLDPVALHRAHPLWHLEDAVQKVNAARVVSPFVVERTIRGNADSDSPWRLESLVAQLRGRVRVHVLAADPALGASFSVEEGERLRSGGDGFGYAVLEGVSHSVHRDYPQRVVVEAMALAAGNASAGSPPNP
jgi:pimeloyl-ACP methyl ester carboxylesterase